MTAADGALPRLQATLGQAFEGSGKGLHTGLITRVRVEPAAPNHGIVFRRTVDGRDFDVEARWPNRRSRPLCTALQAGDGPLVRTVEHLLAALSALAIDNALVVIDGEELPIFDGSAAPWCERIAAAGRVEQGAPRRYVRVVKRVDHQDGPHKQRIEPSKAFSMDVAITLAHFGRLRWKGRIGPDVFVRELAPSRSFGRLGWALAAKALGFLPNRDAVLRGADMKNVAALYGRRAVGGLRMPDEPVRHRALDLVGDFALVGRPVIGRIVASRPGHEHNFGLLSALMKDKRAWDLIEIGEDGKPLRVWDA